MTDYELLIELADKLERVCRLALGGSAVSIAGMRVSRWRAVEEECRLARRKILEHLTEEASVEASIPKSIWAGTFTVFGVTLRCHVLDDGQRIIEAEDVHKLLAAMQGYEPATGPGDMDAFVRWQKGE